MLSWFTGGSKPSNQDASASPKANKTDENNAISKPQLRIPKDPRAGAHKLDFKIGPPQPSGEDDKIILPSPTKGILVNQDAAKPTRKKTVAFDPSTPAADHHKPRPQPRVRSGLPADCPGKFPSPWTPRTAQQDEKTANNTEANAQTAGSKKDDHRMDDIRRPLFTDKKPDLAPPSNTVNWGLEPITTRNEPQKKDAKAEDWRIEDLKYQLEGALAENESMKARLKEALRIKKQNERLTRANDAALHHIKEREIELKGYEDAIQKYEADLQEAEKKVAEYERRARDADDRMNQLSIMFDESGMQGFNPSSATDSNTDVRDLKRELRKTKRDAENNERNLQLEIEDLKIQLREANATMTKLRNDRQQLVQECRRLQQENQEANKGNFGSNSNTDSQGRLAQMKLETENARLRRENEAKDRQLENLLQQLDEAKSLGLSLNLGRPVSTSSPKPMEFDDDPFFNVGESKANSKRKSGENILEESFDWGTVTGPGQAKANDGRAPDFDTLFAPKQPPSFNPNKFSPTFSPPINRASIDAALKPTSPPIRSRAGPIRRTSPRKSFQSKPSVFAEEGKPITNYDNDLGFNSNNNNFGFNDDFSNNNNNNFNDNNETEEPTKPWQKKPVSRPAARPAAKAAASAVTKPWQKKTAAASKPATSAAATKKDEVKPWHRKPGEKPWLKNNNLAANIKPDNFIPLDGNLDDLLGNDGNGQDRFGGNNNGQDRFGNNNNGQDRFGGNNSNNNQDRFSSNNNDNFSSNNNKQTGGFSWDFDGQNQNQQQNELGSNNPFRNRANAGSNINQNQNQNQDRDRNSFGSNNQNQAQNNGESEEPLKPWQRKPTANAVKPWQKKTANSGFNNNINQDNFIPLDDNQNQNNFSGNNQNQNDYGSKQEEPLKPWQKKAAAPKPWQKKPTVSKPDNFISFDELDNYSSQNQDNFSSNNQNQNFNGDPVKNDPPAKPWQKKAAAPKPWQRKATNSNFNSNLHDDNFLPLDEMFPPKNNLHSDAEEDDVPMDLADSPPIRKPLSPRKSSTNDNLRHPPTSRYDTKLKSVSPRPTYVGLLESPRPKPASRTTAAGTRRVSDAGKTARNIDPARRAQAERRLAEKRRLAVSRLFGVVEHEDGRHLFAWRATLVLFLAVWKTLSAFKRAAAAFTFTFIGHSGVYLVAYLTYTFTLAVNVGFVVYWWIVFWNLLPSCGDEGYAYYVYWRLFLLTYVPLIWRLMMEVVSLILFAMIIDAVDLSGVDLHVHFRGYRVLLFDFFSCSRPSIPAFRIPRGSTFNELESGLWRYPGYFFTYVNNW
ncbi:hypothetical protein BJ508DRAFT_378356 [Ascobolus immersus RN42]|uniref:Uncharacterized protein n=1 Tax=Ascobolus immersus RN42 TaxID=1160509 RepID=A0A3N4I2E2_ASCIM|nr:hypothetical protein BJ508DRAFT_378356 [Ascobolus immersus RN42]